MSSDASSAGISRTSTTWRWCARTTSWPAGYEPVPNGGTHIARYVSRHLAFNQWFKTRSRDLTPAIELLNTTSCPISSTAQKLAAWIRDRS
jgi:hypothetical protein